MIYENLNVRNSDTKVFGISRSRNVSIAERRALNDSVRCRD